MVNCCDCKGCRRVEKVCLSMPSTKEFDSSFKLPDLFASYRTSIKGASSDDLPLFKSRLKKVDPEGKDRVWANYILSKQVKQSALKIRGPVNLWGKEVKEMYWRKK